jgi:hypothetical protein
MTFKQERTLMNRTQKAAGIIVAAAVGASLFIAALMWIIPTYSVWQQTKYGQAKLMRAGQERQILVEQAQAEKDSAQLRADAIKILGEAAKDFPEYRSQEFMAAFGEALQNNPNLQIIYVPTEANIPITEAYRFQQSRDQP